MGPMTKKTKVFAAHGAKGRPARKKKKLAALGPKKMQKPLVLAIVGPTASGKTELAREVARRIGGEMISCDSMQVYQGMPVLTQAPLPIVAGPDGAHLSAFIDPSIEYNAAQFRRQAEALIPEIIARKRVPILVGGTGLYLRMLLDGLFEAQDGQALHDETIRRKLYEEQEQTGGEVLHKRLRKVDPESAAKIHPNDIRRIVRALEVYELTGHPISEKKRSRQGIRHKYDVRLFMPVWDRLVLYERIDRRVDQMVGDGLVDEVKKVLSAPLGRTASMALGIRQIRDHLEGKVTLAQAVLQLKKDTRNYAKRQLTWFRHEVGVEAVQMHPGISVRSLADIILGRI